MQPQLILPEGSKKFMTADGVKLRGPFYTLID